MSWPWNRRSHRAAAIKPFDPDNTIMDNLDIRAGRHHQVADYQAMYHPRQWPDLRPLPDKALAPVNVEHPQAPLMTPGQEWRAGLRTLDVKGGES